MSVEDETHEKQYNTIRQGSYFTFHKQLDTAARAGVDARTDYHNDEFMKWKDLQKEIREAKDISGETRESLLRSLGELQETLG